MAERRDFYTPDGGQRIAADGTVVYDFAGHVHAKGLDLDAADVAVLDDSPADNRLRWLNALGGAAADIVATSYGRLSAQAYTADAKASLMAHDVSGGPFAALDAAVGGSTGSSAGASLSARLSRAIDGVPIKALIFDDSGASSFLRLAVDKAIRLALAYRVLAVPAGWGTYSAPAINALPAGQTGLYAVYSVRPLGAGASLVNHELQDFNNSTVWVNVNSAVAQNIAITGLIFATY